MTQGRVQSDHRRDEETRRAALEAQLADRFLRPLRLFAARRLGDAGAADDVAQAVLERVVAALRADRVRTLDALGAFVYATARHLCLHRARSAGRERRALAALATAGPVPARPADALSGLIQAERRRLVRRALARLPEGDRELLRALYYELLEPAEAARRLAVSPGAFRVRRHRALRRLAALLEEGSPVVPGNARGPAGTESL